MRITRLPADGCSAAAWSAAPNAPAIAAIPPRLSNSRRSMWCLPAAILSDGSALLHETRRQMATLFQIVREIRIRRRERTQLSRKLAGSGVSAAAAFKKRTKRAIHLAFQQRGRKRRRNCRMLQRFERHAEQGEQQRAGTGERGQVKGFEGPLNCHGAPLAILYQAF